MRADTEGGSRMPISRRAILLSVGAAVGPAPYVRAAESSNIDLARGHVRELLATNTVPASSFAVMRGPDLLWAEAFGKVNIELDVAATPAHRFRLGSVSKVITATLAATLAARGIVDLDAPIVQYMPDLPQPHHATTLQQLLTHRGGIRHYLPKDDARTALGPIDLRHYPGTADVLAVFINDPLVAKPGERVSYSTFGYTLASLVIEAAAKTPFLDLLQREIAKPLELESLGGDTQMALVPNRVTGYQPGDIVRKAQPDFQGAYANVPSANVAYKWAGGGLLATATDLAKFGAAHLTAGRIPAAALKPLFTVHTQATSDSPPLGLGWRINEDNEHRLRWHHAGGQLGARASIVVYPNDRLSIAFATNVTGIPANTTELSERIADAFV
jgi:CubicO group peptidase (beta-lactamase class C family)